MRLHTTVGPAATTISGVADEAGVTRATVYRYFPESRQLFAACSARWAELHPAPDPARWLEIGDFPERARVALGELYAYYRENRSDLETILSDLEAIPETAVQAMRDQQARMAASLVEGCGPGGEGRRRLEAVAGHLVGFPTWRSLVVEQGLSDAEAVDAGATFLTSVRDG